MGMKDNILFLEQGSSYDSHLTQFMFCAPEPLSSQKASFCIEHIFLFVCLFCFVAFCVWVFLLLLLLLSKVHPMNKRQSTLKHKTKTGKRTHKKNRFCWMLLLLLWKPPVKKKLASNFWIEDKSNDNNNKKNLRNLEEKKKLEIWDFCARGFL